MSSGHRRDDRRIGRLKSRLEEIACGGGDGIVASLDIIADFAGAEPNKRRRCGGPVRPSTARRALRQRDRRRVGPRAGRDIFRATRERNLREIHENLDFERKQTLGVLQPTTFGGALRSSWPTS